MTTTETRPIAAEPTTEPTFTPAGLDALVPGEVARKAETVGVMKAGLEPLNVFVLSILAGAFIAMGAIFATTVAAGAPSCRTVSSGFWPAPSSRSA